MILEEEDADIKNYNLPTDHDHQAQNYFMKILMQFYWTMKINYYIIGLVQ